MYLQITSRCNMSCAHCCYNCTAEGKDMSLSTFHKALDICKDIGDTPFIGGGEPTLHPQFEQMLLEAVACAAEIGEGVVGIITNGSIRQRALLIAQLAKGGIISGSVSQDEYHDPIDADVIQAFTDEHKGSQSARHGHNDGVWDTSHGGSREPHPHGRAKELIGWNEDDYEDGRGEDDCPGCGLQCEPSGDFRQCGCEDSPIVGNVEEGVNTPSFSDCYHSPWFVEQCLDHEHEFGHLLYA